MTEHQEALDAWVAADRPEIPHPVPGIDIRRLDRWLGYQLANQPEEEYLTELARIRRHLGLDI